MPKRRTIPQPAPIAAEVDNTPVDASDKAQDAPEVRRAAHQPIGHADVFKGTYRTTSALNLRNQAGMDAGKGCTILAALPKGIEVRSGGSYTVAEGMRWLYVEADLDGIRYAGFCAIRFLEKIEQP